MSFKRVKWVKKLLNKKEYKKAATLDERKFTRKRKLTLQDLILFILNNKGKTLTLELNEYMRKNKLENITKQAYSKQRQYINPKIFKMLNNDYVKKNI